MNFHDLLLNLLIVLGSATLIVTLFHSVRVPAIVAFLATGMLVGPQGLALVDTAIGAQTLTELGAVFLMFTIGIEFSFRRLKELRRPIMGLGLNQVWITIALITGLSLILFGVSWQKALFFGLLASLSSTATVLKLLQDGRDLESPYGQSTLGILIFQDLAVVPMILLTPLLGPNIDSASLFSFGAMSRHMFHLALVLGGIWAGAKYVIPFVLDRVVRTKNRELFFFFILFICFGVAFIVENAGLSLSLGAFLAGIMISESPYGKQAMSDFAPLRDNFLSFFFISIGMLLDVSFLVAHLPTVLGLTLLLMSVKLLIVYGLGRMMKYAVATSFVSALLVFQVGEFSFILLQAGLPYELLTPMEMQYFLSVAIVTLALTPLIYRWAPKLSTGNIFEKWMPIEKVKEKKSQPEKGQENTKTIIIGFGPASQNVAAALKSLEIPYTIVDINPEIAKQKKKGESIVFGDATNRHILEQAGIAKARLVIVTISASKLLSKVIRSITELRSDIHIIVRAQYLREVNELSKFSQVELVVSEFETSLEVLARTLTQYGVSSKKIHKFMLESRERFHEKKGVLTDSLRSSIDLPAWEALKTIYPFKIEKGHYAVGKDLEQLRLRKNVGASVVVVFREGLGATIPGADFCLEADDVVHLIGSPKSFKRAEQLLTDGQLGEENTS